MVFRPLKNCIFFSFCDTWNPKKQKKKSLNSTTTTHLAKFMFFLLYQFVFCKQCLIETVDSLISIHYECSRGFSIELGKPICETLKFYVIFLHFLSAIFDLEAANDKYEISLNFFLLFFMSLTLGVLGPILQKKWITF